MWMFTEHVNDIDKQIILDNPLCVTNLYYLSSKQAPFKYSLCLVYSC